MKDNIYLIGFMGSGKSTIGKELAAKCGYQWTDLDRWIEDRQKMTIRELFEHYGEDYFRSIETKSLHQLAGKKQLVISTGGGIIVSKENIRLLKNQKTFYLKWPFDILYKRISGDVNRPLVKSYGQLQKLYLDRERLYEKACSKCINGEGKSIACIIEEILKKAGAEDENSSD